MTEISDRAIAIAEEATRRFMSQPGVNPTRAELAAQLALDGWEPVDDVEAVREIVARQHEFEGRPVTASAVLRGERDLCGDLQLALAAYKAGRKAEREAGE